MVVWCIASRRRKQDRPLVGFTGGGTGGHVYPGLAVAHLLVQRSNVDLLWIGSRRGIEREIVGATSVRYVGIPSGKLRRYFSLRTVIDACAVVAGIFRSMIIMAVRRPALVFAKGGYVSVPPVIAAAVFRVPVVTHDSDADPGLATRINARFACRVLVAYSQTALLFPEKIRSRVSVTGNPIRDDIGHGDRTRGLAFCGFDASGERPSVLVLGGSLGARDLNEAILRALPRMRAKWNVIHQTGDRSSDLPLPDSDKTYFRSRYLGAELPDLLAAADLIICRAGASTLWECASMSKPMILVPLGGGSRGDQARNAALFEEAAAAMVLQPGDDLARGILSAAEHLEDSERRSVMGRNARQLIHIDSTDQIVTILKGLLEPM